MQDIHRIAPRILSATDFSAASERAFLHALGLAAGQHARLTLLHIGPESRKEVPWDKYPGVRDTLVKWQMMEADAPRTDVMDQLGMNVKKMAMRDEDPYNGILDYVRKHPTDLLVMATGARSGAARMKRASVAESVSYSSHSHALLLPDDTNDLVDIASGSRLLKNALVIYDHEPDPRNAISWLSNWLPMFAEDTVDAHLLYVGDEETVPEVAIPTLPKVNWKPAVKNGPLRETILAYADEVEAQMIVMMNEPSRGLLGRLRGSLCEQILRQSGRPMLLMPDI